MKPINNNFKSQYRNEKNEAPTLYTLILHDYKTFIHNVEKSDMKNAYTRYIGEHKFLKRLIELAQEENRTEEIQKLQSRLETVEGELSKRGIKINN